MLFTLVPLSVFMYGAMASMLAIIGMGFAAFGIIEIVKKTKNRNFIPIVLSIAFVIVGIGAIAGAVTMIPTLIEMIDEVVGFFL